LEIRVGVRVRGQRSEIKKGWGQSQRSKIRDQEIRGQEVRDWSWSWSQECYVPEKYYHEKSGFAKGSVGSNRVIDLIFELSIVYAREAADKQWESD
jgi:hypothetical protein